MFNNLLELVIEFPILLFCITIHEFMHGYVADKYGDDTARMMGRLTLNPLAHIDLVGTIILPLLSALTHLPMFGWAKPVPVNPYRLNNPKKDMIWVGLAGPASNLMLAIFAGICLWLLRTYAPKQILSFTYPLFQFLLVINVVLLVFNLIPVPPLDGSRIVSGLLPPELAYKYESITPYGFIIIIFLLSSNILSPILGPVVNFIVQLLSGFGPGL
jgi:Zn-dependent protease